ncbi:hypothetical protein COU01_04420 [Candidatus Falkowbacteria bacterium CG10_big_fil_rev_8_21_14_0_10_44_15]|uniref:Uncharacterized protein n=1 Tax=Candidatus Falkowbacteria bacterium CG10_big_fil_rev_8_21_14_0_10_44_15 TaxID=1974569 RepID=A0A2H0UYR7_9BACT|nr:MAG: hypothetical protein COU01_04420 [Candidatus Falkowbacteria bacterium CG10_big_fil_rev_8_21_14_0_10_44_15]
MDAAGNWGYIGYFPGGRPSGRPNGKSNQHNCAFFSNRAAGAYADPYLYANADSSAGTADRYIYRNADANPNFHAHFNADAYAKNGGNYA